MNGGTTPHLRLGCCVTGHGFGHAARAEAVITALARRVDLKCTLLTTVPEWFFATGPGIALDHHHLVTDVGLVQRTGLREDMDGTLAALDRMFPLDPALVARAARLFDGCELILCDIAPLGIVAARKLGIPSLLVENFTWDWIYRAYLAEYPELKPFCDILDAYYRQATVRVQARPVCAPRMDAVQVPVVYRPALQPGDRIRAMLGIPASAPMILVTMGGIGGDEPPLAVMSRRDDLFFVLAGQEKSGRRGNVLTLQRTDPVYHPDLVAAADVVVGKAGYSTLAEAWGGRTPFGYVSRQRFPESLVLAEFMRKQHIGVEIPAPELANGGWLDRLDALLSLDPGGAARKNGAEAIADLVLAMARGEAPEGE